MAFCSLRWMGQVLILNIDFGLRLSLIAQKSLTFISVIRIGKVKGVRIVGDYIEMGCLILVYYGVFFHYLDHLKNK